MPRASADCVASALAACGLDRIDAEVLLARVLGRNRAWLIAHAADPLPAPLEAEFAILVARRRRGEPVAYLTGRREFRGLVLGVDPAVLIPRPETETLVEVALAKLPIDRATQVLDLGTGSGAIALAVAHERPLARVLATDRSRGALAVARRNARRLDLANVAFAGGNWYEALRAKPAAAASRMFDLIACNPPYVAEGDPHLVQGDLRFEPRRALAAGPDGLDALRAIVAGAGACLMPGGWLVVEHGYDQARAVRALFARARFTEFAAARDLAGITRVAAGRRPMSQNSVSVSQNGASA